MLPEPVSAIAVSVVGPLRVDVRPRLERRTTRLAGGQVHPGDIQRQLLFCRRRRCAHRGEHVGGLARNRSGRGDLGGPGHRDRCGNDLPPSFRHPLLIDGYMKSCVGWASGPKAGPGAGAGAAAGAAAGAGAGAALGCGHAPVRARPPERTRPRARGTGARFRNGSDRVGRVDARGQVRLRAGHRAGSRGMGDELVDRRRHIPRIGRCRRRLRRKPPRPPSASRRRWSDRRRPAE